MTLAELRAYVRDLTGVYSTDILSDALVDRWLQESYTEFNLARDWPWLNQILSATLPAGGDTISLMGGSSKIKEFTIQYPNGVLYQVPSRVGLLQTVDGDDDIMYDVDTNGVITLSKAVEEEVAVKVLCVSNTVSLQTSGKASMIPDAFEGLLAYRAAVKVLNFQADDSKRSQFFIQEFLVMLDSLESEVILDMDMGPIQIGGEILRVDGRTVGRVNVRFRSI